MQKNITAFHEAAHVVITAVCGGSTSKATIIPTSDMHGYCRINPYDKSGHVMNVYGAIMAHLAGVAAEFALDSIFDVPGLVMKISKSGPDYEVIEHHLKNYFGSSENTEAIAYLSRACEDVYVLLNTPEIWDRVEKLAAMLLAYSEVEEKDLMVYTDGLYELCLRDFNFDCHKFS